MTATRRRAVAVAGHTGDVETARGGLADPDPAVRATGLGALARLGRLTDEELAAAGADPDLTVRRRAATLAAGHPAVDLAPLLADRAPAVIEAAAWACGEREEVDEPIRRALAELGAGHDDPLVREAAVAALGALGHDDGLDVILAAVTGDRPAVRRRAVLALAPFVDPEHPRAAAVAAALAAAVADRDWQVRQAADDVRSW